MPLYPDFPSTPILDDFNRANENPLSQSGAWTTMAEQGALQVVSNQVLSVSPSDGTSYRAVTLGDSEVYLKFATILGAGQAVALGLRIKDNGGASPIRLSRMDGYRLILSTAGSYFVTREDNAASTNLFASTSWAGGALVDDDSVGFRIVGSQLEVWMRRGSGTWVRVNTATDSTYTSGAITLYLQNDGTKPRCDDFGGGLAQGVASLRTLDFTKYPSLPLTTVA